MPFTSPMKTALRPLLAFVVLASIAAVGALACSGDDDSADPTPAAQATAAPTDIPVTYAPAGAVTFDVLAGYTESAVDVEAFMPADIRVRVGDTIRWKAHGIEGHTVTFGTGDDTLASIGPYLLPNPQKPSEQIFSPVLALKSPKQGTMDGDATFINSGFFGVPVEATYELKFTKEGLYTYICLVHPFTMNGTVAVEPAAAQVPSPETVAAQGERDRVEHVQGLQAEMKRLQQDAVAAQGPGDATTHYVQVGAITDYGQAAVYTPAVIKAKAGDTVIFNNDDRNFHNVIFQGSRAEAPPGIGIVAAPDGQLNFSLDQASAVAVDPPAEGFDDTTFLSSGSMGVTLPRLTWTLRFDKPGTYRFQCTIHALAGMAGVIEVE